MKLIRSESSGGGGGAGARKALATRHRVLDAAETLFVRDGYAATTIAAIAEEADVAVQTVWKSDDQTLAGLTPSFRAGSARRGAARLKQHQW